MSNDFEENLLEYAAKMRDHRRESENAIDHYLMILAAGAATLSITLVGILDPPLQNLPTLTAAWIGFLVGIVSIFIAMKIGVAALNKAINIAQSDSTDFKCLNRYNVAIGIFNSMAFTSVLLAMILLGVFAYTNVGDKNDGTEQKPEQQQAVSKNCCRQ